MALDEGAIEAVARALCKEAGRDPDELVSVLGDIRHHWERYCPEASRWIACHTALWEHMRVSARKKEWQAP